MKMIKCLEIKLYEKRRLKGSREQFLNILNSVIKMIEKHCCPLPQKAGHLAIGLNCSKAYLVQIAGGKKLPDNNNNMAMEQAA